MYKILGNILKSFAILFLIVTTLIIYYFCLLFCACASDSLMKNKILHNKDVACIKIIGTSELESLLPWFYLDNIEIYTKDGYKIFLHNVTWTLTDKNYDIYQINDIACDIYEFKNEGQTYHYPKGSLLFEKVIGKKINSVDDIINNRRELYELFRVFEPKFRKELSEPKTEFIYKDGFIIKADFAREGSPIFENIKDSMIYD